MTGHLESRRNLRAIAICPRELHLHAELQCSGVVWSQPNGRNWTSYAFLPSIAPQSRADESEGFGYVSLFPSR